MRKSMTNFNTQIALEFDPILTIDSRKQGIKREFDDLIKSLTPTQERSPNINESATRSMAVTTRSDPGKSIGLNTVNLADQAQI